MARERAGYEIELARLQKELEQNDAYYRLKYDDSAPDVTELQPHLEPPPGADQLLHTARRPCIYSSLPRAAFLCPCGFAGRPATGSRGWLHLAANGGKRETIQGRRRSGNRLYERLIRPIQAAMPNQDGMDHRPRWDAVLSSVRVAAGGRGGNGFRRSNSGFRRSGRTGPGNPVGDDDDQLFVLFAIYPDAVGGSTRSDQWPRGVVLCAFRRGGRAVDRPGKDPGQTSGASGHRLSSCPACRLRAKRSRPCRECDIWIVRRPRNGSFGRDE